MCKMRDNSKISVTREINVAMSQQSMNNQTKPSFENQLEALEDIVNRLEQGELSLDESLTQFEKGVKLTKDCQKILSQAEQKVMLLNENNQLEEFE